MINSLDAALKGKLKESHFPSTGNSANTNTGSGISGGGGGSSVIVFIVGGVTYEEATKVAEMNSNYPTRKVILGGNTIHNSNTFLTELASY